MGWLKFWIVVFVVLVGSGYAYAEEQWCLDNPSECHCSEPLGATSYVEVSSGYWNPNDSSTKQCMLDGVTGGAVNRNGTIVASTDATALAALPSGHSVSRFMRAQENDHTGGFDLGDDSGIPDSFVRIGMRWYTFHTSLYDYNLQGTCNNSKIAEINGGTVVDWSPSSYHMYPLGFNNGFWSNTVEDCCGNGPGPDAGWDIDANTKGKWIRNEMYAWNRDGEGPGFRFEYYMKNVTDGGAEAKIIDLTSNTDVDNIVPSSLITKLRSNNHRFSASGDCRGWLGFSHLVVAKWTTNSGQRIGAASEIEGGGGSPPPSTPGRFSPNLNLRRANFVETDATYLVHP